jgi:hypothetical protein
MSLSFWYYYTKIICCKFHLTLTKIFFPSALEMSINRFITPPMAEVRRSLSTPMRSPVRQLCRPMLILLTYSHDINCFFLISRFIFCEALLELQCQDHSLEKQNERSHRLFRAQGHHTRCRIPNPTKPKPPDF